MPTPTYNPAEIEPKWQAKWDADGLYHSDIDPKRKKYYALTMLPYPSGDLHIGHWYAMTPSDARARYMRMRGYNVLFPMGFDAFGLPAENAAIKNNIHPKKWTYANIDRMRKQLHSMGAMFDWRREAVSADPEYYKWTEWFFVKLYEAGLAYRKMSPVDWCPHCNTTLAREQVWGEDRHCERCGTPVIKKNLDQWFFRTTKYADELMDYDTIDWPERVRTLQTNWIGRSEGAAVFFKTETGDTLEVFTTRPDTLWGATFMVLAPEHPLVEKITSDQQRAEVEEYKRQAARQSDIQREAADKDKTGVFTGGYAVNPVNGEKIPIWIADYVLMTYGTGAIMAVPAHDERDFDFARKFGLKIIVVVQPEDMDPLDGDTMPAAVPAYGTMVNSGPLSGTPGEDAFEKIIEYLEAKAIGHRTVNYRLRDWLISRQRYWGAPIPMVFCKDCGVVPVPEDQLPVLLPDDVEWRPTGESPLKLHPTWRFTTRPDTLWGATFMVLAPEHPLVEKITSESQRAEVEEYKRQAARQSDIQREAADKDKTGVFTGGYAVNPVNGEKIPIWIADYVLMTYGTGAIMAVPAHDERDFDFARKFGLKIIVVVQPEDMDPLDGDTMPAAVPAYGTMVNSGPLSGTPGEDAFEKIIEYLEAKAIGHRTVNYRLRDWLISRQRYWGAPIPMVFCKDCGVVPVPEDQLPVLLPDDVEWRPTGESPLKLHPTWRFTTCPECGGPAERETDTMDTFMCSSWYHLRYLSPWYDKGPFDPQEYNYWMPVDLYTGGIEHATMHLIYTRFFHKALRDMGVTEGPEPMLMLRNQGMVLGEDSEKMSKSRGNVVAPDALVKSYGADTVRAYLMFFARWDQGGPWNSSGIEGTARWLRRFWTMVAETSGPEAGSQPGNADEKTIRELRRKVHQTLKSITRDYETLEFNTIISSLMELYNEMAKARQQGAAGTPAWNEAVDIYLRMLAPVATHMTEEMWQYLGKPYSIHTQAWPEVDEEAAAQDQITLVVQVNGKLRDRISLPADVSQEDARAAALASEAVRKALDGKPPKQVIVVPGKLVNIVI